MNYIDIGAMKILDGNYFCSIEVHQRQSQIRVDGLQTVINLLMTREELKQLRDTLHNALLDLNMELNYEK